MRETETASARRAALLVHGLSAPGRRRVLERLDDDERAALAPLLHELEQLGVPGSLGGALGGRLPAESPLPPDASPQERVAALEARAVRDGLDACAVSTAVLLLRMADWPWRGALMASLPAARRMEIAEGLGDDAPMLGPAAARELCECLLRELDGRPVAPATGPTGAVRARLSWKGLWRWAR